MPARMHVPVSFAALALAASGAVFAGPSDGPVGTPTLVFQVTGVNPNNNNDCNWSNLQGATPTPIQFSVNPDTGDFELSRSYSLRSNASLAGTDTPLFSIAVTPRDTETGLLSTGGNLDPFMTYGYTVTNDTNTTLTYTATFVSPILPTVTQPNTVRARMSGGLTDGTGDGVTLGLGPGDLDTRFFSLSSVPNALQTDPFVNAGVNVGLAETEISGSGGDSFLYGVHRSPTIAGPLGTWNTMGLQTRFTLTGNGDVASVTGFAEILPIPEPSEIAFMIAGLGLVGSIARRRAGAAVQAVG